MGGKRTTIYDIASELGISASYVSRALNDHPSVSEFIKKRVKSKAGELNYKYNSQAGNLRRGYSKTIGVIVPKINQNFFSNAIAGIEEVCFANNNSLIICQSDESFQKEKIAVETLIGHNVDCIIISVSLETRTSAHLEEIMRHKINLIQFDRYLEDIDSYKIINDNKEVSFNAAMHLIRQGYKRIAFLGGPDHISIFKQRKEGYLKAIKKSAINVPADFIIENALSKETGAKAAKNLLSTQKRPDAIFCASDYSALGVLHEAACLGIKVPEQLGIIGFANEEFTEIINPALSSIDQKSIELGKCAANLYFKDLHPKKQTGKTKTTIIKSQIITRQTSRRKK